MRKAVNIDSRESQQASGLAGTDRCLVDVNVSRYLAFR